MDARSSSPRRSFVGRHVVLTRTSVRIMLESVRGRVEHLQAADLVRARVVPALRAPAHTASALLFPSVRLTWCRMSFVHLHVHTNFSFGDGAGRIDELVGAAQRLGMPALAITDHDGLYGAVRFYQACKAAGVKPIVGVEISVESVLATPPAPQETAGGDPAPVPPVPGSPAHGSPTPGSPTPGRGAPGETAAAAAATPGTATNTAAGEGAAPTTAEPAVAGPGMRANSERERYPRRQPRVPYSGSRSASPTPGPASAGAAAAIVAAAASAAATAAVAENADDARVPRVSTTDLSPSPPRGQFAATGYHLVLLARDYQGWSQLCRIVSAAHLEHRGEPPLARVATLAANHDHLIALSACRRGEVGARLAAGDVAGARLAAQRYAELFGRGDFFIELTDEQLPDSARYVQQLDLLARELRLPTVATNDVHYLAPADAPLHDILAAEAANQPLPNPLGRRNSELFLKTPGQMWRLFGRYPQAYRNAARIAARCNLDLGLGRLLFPAYPLPPGETAYSLLCKHCFAGAAERYNPVTPEVLDRLNRELRVIQDLGFAEYFLAVRDIVQFTRERGIYYSGRGSAGNSIVSYVLRITDADPIANDLLFERFLNPIAPRNARRRHRLRVGAPRRGHRVHLRALRPRPRGHGGQRQHRARALGGAHRRPGLRLSPRRDRRALQKGAVGQRRRPVADARRTPRACQPRVPQPALQAPRRPGRAPLGLSLHPGHAPRRLHPLARPHHRPRAAAVGGQGCDRRPVQQGRHRDARPRQDGHPRPAHAQRHRRSRAAHRGPHRRAHLGLGAAARRPRRLQADQRGAHHRPVPARKLGPAQPRHAAARARLRRRDRRDLAVSARPAAGRDDRAVHPPPTRPREGGRAVPRPVAGAQGHLRRHPLPGAGHRGRLDHRRLQPRRRRPAASRHDPRTLTRRDGRDRPQLRREGGGARRAARRRRRDLPPAPRLRRLRLQQGPRRLLCRGVQRERLAQGALPGRILLRHHEQPADGLLLAAGGAQRRAPLGARRAAGRRQRERVRLFRRARRPRPAGRARLRQGDESHGRRGDRRRARARARRALPLAARLLPAHAGERRDRHQPGAGGGLRRPRRAPRRAARAGAAGARAGLGSEGRDRTGCGRGGSLRSQHRGRGGRGRAGCGRGGGLRSQHRGRVVSARSGWVAPLRATIDPLPCPPPARAVRRRAAKRASRTAPPRLPPARATRHPATTGAAPAAPPSPNPKKKWATASS